MRNPEITGRLYKSLWNSSKLQENVRLNLLEFISVYKIITKYGVMNRHHGITFTYEIIAVSSSSPHLGHIGSVQIFITVRCLLRATWPVTICKCFLLRPKVKHVLHSSYQDQWTMQKHSCLSTSCYGVPRWSDRLQKFLHWEMEVEGNSELLSTYFKALFVHGDVYSCRSVDFHVQQTVCVVLIFQMKWTVLQWMRAAFVDHPRSGVVYNIGPVCLSVCLPVRR